MVAISRAGVARAQEMSGNTADEVKKKIIKLEEEKAAIILKGGTIAADYYERFYDDEAYLSSGRGVRTTIGPRLWQARDLECRKYSAPSTMISASASTTTGTPPLLITERAHAAD